MIVAPTSRHKGPSKALTTAMRLLSCIWLACLLVQAYLAGLAVMGDGAWWLSHRSFGMMFSPLALLLFAVAWSGRMQNGLRSLTALQLLLVILQIGTMIWRYQGGDAWISALHVLNAMLIVSTAVAIAGRASRKSRAEGSKEPSPA